VNVKLRKETWVSRKQNLHPKGGIYHYRSSSRKPQKHASPFPHPNLFIIPSLKSKKKQTTSIPSLRKRGCCIYNFEEQSDTTMLDAEFEHR